MKVSLGGSRPSSALRRLVALFVIWRHSAWLKSHSQMTSRNEINMPNNCGPTQLKEC